MTEKMLAVITQKLEGMGHTLESQGQDIKALSKAFAAQAVHNEQLRSTQAQVTALWAKFDDYCGPTGVITQVRDHQAHCPKDEIRQMRHDAEVKMKRLWGAIGLLATVFATTLVVVITSVSRGG